MFRGNLGNSAAFAMGNGGSVTVNFEALTAIK
jgi:hypothetical protein